MLNRHFAQAGFEQHPDKTFIGRVEKGFDWMGFWFTEKGVRRRRTPCITTF
ncbi:hypothetical protein WM620_005040 [Salmonella enterica]|nr:hypothetical protein [Salmonella enterica]HBX1318046.1 hypothetical protein [Salmonella enterica]